MATSSNVLKQGRVLNSAVLDLYTDQTADGGTAGFRRVSAFKEAQINFDRQSTTITATDDAQFGGQTFRDDIVFTGNFLAPRNLFWLKKIFDLAENTASYGTAVNITGEIARSTYKRGVGGIYEALLVNSHKDGTEPATVSSVQIVDENGTVVEATLVEDTDYEVGLNNGHTTVTAIAGGLIATQPDPSNVYLKVDYTYEPVVSVELLAGEAKTPNSKFFRITEVPEESTDTSEQPHYLQIDLEESIVTTGFQIQFPDKAGERELFEMPVEIRNAPGTKARVRILGR